MADAWVRTNRRWWDERAPHHAGSEFYDLDGFRAGRSDLRPFELEELGVDPTGLELVHLQCHIGTDTLSWARAGAQVTGLDFSEPAIEAARSLAADCGLAAEFVVADVHDAARALGGRQFDVVYTGIGALSWLPDLDRWARVAAGLVRPGGVLYVVEIHPFLWPFAGDGSTELKWDCFDALESDSAAGSYVDRELVTEHDRVIERNAGIGSVLTAVVQAGLVVELVQEHPVGVERYFDGMVRGEDRLWRMGPDQPQVPLLWSFRARRPGARPSP